MIDIHFFILLFLRGWGVCHVVAETVGLLLMMEALFVGFGAVCVSVA